MKTIDRFIFGIIALALAALALQPYIADAGRAQDVNIAAVGGYQIRGGTLPIR